ncbi:MAG: chitobiase/beta-hexosaminidase C-terminal domain-containing protein [Polyangiaceae bacterium]|nr:chitobiase/beta-hexosaminidase C-terminal domain-containing protein [Polyangiaceae bacterium]
MAGIASTDTLLRGALALVLVLTGSFAGCGNVSNDGDDDGGVDASAGGGGMGGNGGVSGGSGGAVGTGGSGGSAGTGGNSGSGGTSASGGSSTGGSGGSGTGGNGGSGGFVPQPCDTPTFSPVGGTYSSGQGVTISTKTPNATIFYTTDGTNPDQNSAVYSTPISIWSKTTLRAMCNALPVYTDSTVAFATYTFSTGSYTNPPTPIPAAGTFANDFLLSLTTTTPGGTICFALGGALPECANGVCQGATQTYSSQAKIPVNGGATNASTGELLVNALWCKAGMTNGVMPAQKYILQVATPELTAPAPGQYAYDSANQSISPLLSTATTGNVSLRYTTSAASPPSCTNGTLVSGTLPIDTSKGNATYLVAACKPGYKDSAVYTASYTFQLKPPIFAANGGSFDAPVAVNIGNAANAGAVGTWTCTTSDGTTPGCGASASTCAGTGSSATSVLVNKTATALRAISCSPAFVSSDLATSNAFALQLGALTFTPPSGTPVGAGALAVALGQSATGGQAYSFICYSKTAAVPDCTCAAPGLTKVNGNSASNIMVTANTTLTAVGCDDGSSGSELAPTSGSASYGP